jgi:hypothetical protein
VFLGMLALNAERNQAMYQLGWVYAPLSPWLTEAADYGDPAF